ncbi:aspartate aminotransferase family protein [Haloferula chungangensis]|uniref:Aspartate aminotransferase family protein n=1 Tax=Haloferula chungangensis TaxID=1048331 RepID=A0ABW2L8Y7_9BACT
MSHILSTYGRFPLTLVKGEGTRVWDEAGNSYLDFCSGIAVCALGHSPKVLVDAISQQAATLIHCCNLYHIPQQEELATLIVEKHVKLPGKVFFANSGAESNDGLIKSARRYGHANPQADGSPRYEVLSFKQSFHGRTLAGISATGQDKVKEGFNPLPTGFRHLPFNDLDALTAAIAPETVAIILEPIQGEGGVNVATPEFLRGVAALCKKHDLLLLLDEVQVGFGRCGDPMAWREIAPELEPDGISWAKGMGGGFPIGAFWLSDRPLDRGLQSAPENPATLSSLMGPGSHGTTYGGSPLACAASLAVLKEIADKKLIENVRAQEAHIRETIALWNHPLVTEVRGKGLLIGIGLDTEKMSTPEGKLPSIHLSAELIKSGLLAPPAGPATLRLLPPLNVTTEEVDQALKIVHSTLTSLQTSP